MKKRFIKIMFMGLALFYGSINQSTAVNYQQEWVGCVAGVSFCKTRCDCIFPDEYTDYVTKKDKDKCSSASKPLACYCNIPAQD